MHFDFHANRFANIELDGNKLAISGLDGDLTWTQLKEEVEAYKNLFVNLGIPAGHPVMIYGHQEARFLVIVLALVSLDIPYIPIDKIYPEDRLASIQEQSGAQVIVKSGNYGTPDVFPIVVESDRSVIKSKDVNFSSQYGSANDQLRYIMFTSGSTGAPKGVQISRSAYLSFIDWLQSDHPFNSGDVFLNQAPFSFDLSVYNILGALSIGSSLVLFDYDTCSDYDKFIARLEEYGVTTWISTPSFVYMFLRVPELNSSHLPKLRKFVFIGETLPQKTVKDLRSKFRDGIIINSYGPTEATVATCFVTLSDELVDTYNDLPIGTEKMNGEVYTFHNNVPADEGELVIVGDHVSLGYLKRPELNQEKFFMWEGKRAYRTGDQGYFKDGYLFFLGRNDKQIKLNGYRIELGEINSVIENSGFVEASVILPLKRNEVVKKIVGIAIPKTDYQGRLDDLKASLVGHLSSKLPSYMMPGDIRFIIEFPVNVNHKIDMVRLTDMYVKGEIVG